MDKKRYFIAAIEMAAIVLAIFLVGCGGNNAPAPELAVSGTGGQDSSTSADESAAAPEEEAAEPAAAETEEDVAAEEAAAEAPAEEEAAEAPAADDSNLLAGLPTSGLDPETGLEINPAQIVPGVDFIVRGTVISFNLTPQDSPEFLIESPGGMRYRVNSQPVPDIAFEDGTVLQPFEYQRGILAQATVRQEEGSGVTSVVISENLVLLNEE